MKKAILWGVVALTLLAFVGCKDDDGGKDGPISFTLKISDSTLTITGVPANISTTIFAATLFEDLSAEPPNLPVPLAVGMNTNGTFSFYTYVAPMTPGGTPAFGAEFTTLGNYYIVLATSITGAPPNYIYVEPVPQAPTMSAPAKYNFQNPNSNLAWDKFVDQSTLGQ
jgi:hypothetical protein